MALYEDTWCQLKREKNKRYHAIRTIQRTKPFASPFFLLCYFIFMDFYFEHIIPTFVKFIQKLHWLYIVSFLPVHTLQAFHLFDLKTKYIFCTHGFWSSLPNLSDAIWSHNIFVFFSFYEISFNKFLIIFEIDMHKIVHIIIILFAVYS